MHYLGFIEAPWLLFNVLLLVLLLFWVIAYSRGALKALFILSIVLVVLNLPLILYIPVFVNTLLDFGLTSILKFPLFLDFACFILGVWGIIKRVRNSAGVA
jgi:hypothetical protein